MVKSMHFSQVSVIWGKYAPSILQGGLVLSVDSFGGVYFA